MGTASLLYVWYRDWRASALLLAAFMVNSTALAYLDIYFALPLLGALWALKKRHIALASFLAILAASIKWQPLIVAPFFLAYLLKGEDGRLQPRQLLSAFWPVALTAIVLAMFYGYDPIQRSFLAAVGHGGISGNALNFNWLLLYYLETAHQNIVGGQFHGLVISSAPSIRTTILSNSVGIFLWGYMA